VGEIDHPQDPEYQRKPGCNNEKNHPLAQAIYEHEEKKLYGHAVFLKMKWF
jgi:hypothetical protein